MLCEVPLAPATTLSLSLLKPVVLALRGLTTVAFLAVGVVLIVALLPFFEGAGSYPWVTRIVAFDAVNIERVRALVPTKIGRLDFARTFLALLVLLAAATLDFAANKLSGLSSGSGARKRFRRRKKRTKKAKKQPKTSPVASATTAAGGEDKKSREELVRLMVEAKRELDAMTRDVAFFALDVVESTNMKLGEDRAFVEHDFKEFKKMVDEATARGGLLKSAWTPDGAMLCFDSFESAVRAAQAMLRKLPAFNAGTRMMGTPFRVRCGVNSGRVQYDAAQPMEAMSDNVIDVAGHMQKYADPDTIYVATDLLSKNKVNRGFAPADTEVDGYAVSVWRGPSAHL
jgi:class 3 adenylate cyclase